MYFRLRVTYTVSLVLAGLSIYHSVSLIGGDDGTAEGVRLLFFHGGGSNGKSPIDPLGAAADNTALKKKQRQKEQISDSADLLQAGRVRDIAVRALALHETPSSSTSSRWCTPENATDTLRTLERFAHAVLSAGTEFHFVREIALTFQAMDRWNQSRSVGGDYFVLTFHGWIEQSSSADDDAGEEKVAFKTAKVARDWLNGSYSVDFKLPASRLDAWNLTLSHYHSCFQGYGPNWRHEDFLPLDFQPKPVTPLALTQFLATGSKDAISFSHYPGPLPPCNSVDQLMDGAWVEKGSKVNFQGNFTRSALWFPFHCHNLRLMRYEFANKTTRIGDSTMPQRAVEVGDPFYHYLDYNKKFGHHNRWVEFLQVLLHEATNEKDVIIFGGGLHQLARQYSVPTSVDLLTRMVCQLAAVSPTKLLVIGVPPIQQHMFWKVDNTATNVRWLNEELSQRFDSINGSIAELCRDVDLTEMFGHADKDGNSQQTPDVPIVWYEYGFRPSEQERSLTRYFATISKKDNGERLQRKYQNRTVLFSDIHDVLLSRAETYRDKLHYQNLNGYRTVLDQLAQLRRRNPSS